MDGEGCVVGLTFNIHKSKKLDKRGFFFTSTTVSDTLGLGTTEYVHIILSGYSSRILEIRRVPMPAPVPPPRECVIWKPITCKEKFTKRKKSNRNIRITLEAISAFSLFTHNIQDSVDELSTFSIICKLKH